MKLKEEYIIFNSTFTYLEAKENTDVLIDEFIKANIFKYDEFVMLLKIWKEEIVNLFIKIYENRINDDIAE